MSLPKKRKVSDENSQSKKRNRTPNFTIHEEARLVNIVLKYKNIVENKKTDAITTNKKNSIWDKIKGELEAETGISRDTKSLKLKYQNMKNSVRKTACSINKSRKGTGGGPSTATWDDVPPHELKLYEAIQISCDGLGELTDDDSHSGFKSSSEALSQAPSQADHLQGSHPIVVTVPHPTSFNNSSRSCISLDNLPSTSNFVDSNPFTPVESPLHENIEFDAEVIEREKGDGDINGNEHESEGEIDEGGENDVQVKSNWGDYTPKLLKQPKHTILDTKNRGRRKTNEGFLTDKWSRLADRKTSLVDLQRKCLEIDVNIAEERLKLAQEERIQKAEEHRIKIQILNIELQHKSSQYNSMSILDL